MWRQAPRTYLNQILVLQKSALRLTYFAPYRYHAIPLFVSSCSLPITLIHFKSIYIVIRDVFINLAPHNSSKLFSYSAEMYSGNFYFNYYRSSHQFKSFCRSGAKLWNGIPSDSWKLPKFSCKKKLREYLLKVLIQEDDYASISAIMTHFRNFKPN